MKEELELLSRSPFLDDAWYRGQYPDVEMLQMNSAEHYLRIGAQLMRKPSERFDTAYYLESNPDVAGAAINPLVHYLRFGEREGRAALRPSTTEERGLVLVKAGAPSAVEHSHVFLSDELDAAGASVCAALCATVHGIAQANTVRAVISNLSPDTRVFLFAPGAEHTALRLALANDYAHVQLIPTDTSEGETAVFMRLMQRLNSEGVDVVCRIASPGQDAGDKLRDDGLALVGSRAQVATVLTAFASEPSLGMVGTTAALRTEGDGDNNFPYFASGSMWLRTAIFSAIADNAYEADGDTGLASGRIAGTAGWRVGVIQRRSMNSDAVAVDARPDSPLVAANKSGWLTGTVEADRTRLLIEAHSAFDAGFYAQQTTEPQQLGMDPLFHYALYGDEMKLDPAPWFSSRIYRAMYGHLFAENENGFAHYLAATNKHTLLPFPSQSNVSQIAKILAESKLVDFDYYLANNDDVRATGVDPMRHYCRHGWSELRRPNSWFDGWWYGVTYLGELDGVVNPLLHYALFGKAAGYAPAPVSALQNRVGTGMQYQRPFGEVRRVALYAGYDVDGVIDEYVLNYLSNLSQVADVYYLADSDMPQSELDKLSPFVKGAWARRHQTYDFGSYSLLAKDFVGWDVIDSYDELILANDSCYLVGDFARVFETMHARQCDWWGLQATKGIAATSHLKANRFEEKIPLTAVKSAMLGQFEGDYLYDFHVGSYFLVYRKPVIRDAEFQNLLNMVGKQRTKKLIIQRYEIGFTKFLINKGYEFDTLIADLYPFHPIFTPVHFELIERGFPLLKRFLLSENHYKIPALYRWKQWLNAVAPNAPLDMIENNLLRVVSNEKLYASMNVNADGKTQQERLLSDQEIAIADEHVAKDANWWVFPVCGYNHTLGGNERAVFEHVKNDPSIKKIILTRSRHVDLEGENVVIVPIRSVEGQQYLLRSKVVFVKHTPTRNTIYPLRADLRHFINLWHGIPLKRIGAASLDQQARLDKLYEEHRRCRSVIASSKIDQMAMASAFYPLTYNDVWVTGLPRNDFVVCTDEALPGDMLNDVAAIRAMLGGKRMVFYAPTFRNPGEDSYYAFSAEQKLRLKALLDRHNCLLGIREHLADKTRSYSAELAEIGAINLGDKRFANIEVIYRCADVLLTDYSSCFIDFLLTGKPVLSFAYDYDRYITQERGLFYDMEMVFPGPICKTFEALFDGLERALNGQQRPEERYASARSIFFDYVDDNNSGRLVARVKSL